LSRLITTFDEVPPYWPSAIHIAFDHGVSLFKTCTAEVFRPVPFNENLRFSLLRDSQGLRRPRFSFFIFTCQTARGGKTPLPLMGVCETPFRRQMTTDWISVVDSLIKMRSFTGTKTVLAEGQGSAALSGSVYKPGPSSLSTVDVNKSSHLAALFWATKKPRLLRTSCRT
jgi:hypothetical protein